MQIRDTFATTIQKRIEPVVKVIDRQPEVLLNELNSLVVTPQWERYLRGILDSYADAADRNDEQGIGVWISGFFGSGKSLMVKVLGALLEDAPLLGQSPHDLFLARLPLGSPDRDGIARLLAVIRRKLTTTVVGGNLHALQANSDDPLALIVFRLFAKQRGFTQNWPFAWAIEYQLDERGKTSDFRQRASDLAGLDWEEIALDPEFYHEHLNAAVADVLPEHFSNPAAVERAVTMAAQSGITSVVLVERLRRWCAARDGGGRRHKLLLQLDELGQWIQGGGRTERAQQVQALLETAASAGGGRIWIAVTAHGDVQELRSSLQQEEYAKINQRFANKCKLSNDDISKVVEQRLLRKTAVAQSELEARFNERPGALADLGTVQGRRVYPTPTAANFALFYPYMPWTVAIIPDVVKGIAQAAGRDEALTGSNRTMIGVVQGAIIETPGLLEARLDRLLCLADLYDQVATDAPIETKTDLNRIRETVPGATDFTPRVARALYLLGAASHVPTTLDHLVRALTDRVDADLAELRARVEVELARLVQARYAKHVGEEFFFLSTQQRGFQDLVRSRQEEIGYQTYELSQALKEYESADELRFDKVALHGRELALKLEIDGRVARNPAAHVVLRVASPFQKAIDTQIGNDAVMKQRANEEPNSILIRLGDVPGFHSALTLAVATDQVANEVLASPVSSEPEKEVARQARQHDLASYKTEVRRLLGAAVRSATVFFRGTFYPLLPGESHSAAMRATIAQLLPQIYARFADLPVRIANEETAVKAALAHNTAHPDLQQLGVFRADGTLNDAHPLISTLRARLPAGEQYQQYVQADALRSELEKPPYGWDPNSVKVGLALLLRASACRLIDNARTLTDPSDPEVALLLIKELRFKALRVQGVRSDLGMPELQEIRRAIEALFGAKPTLVQATLNTVLGDKLAELAQRVREVQSWANTARCPLPPTFESGAALVAELLNNGSAAARLPRFREQHEALGTFSDTLGRVQQFQREFGSEFVRLRDFFMQVVYADIALDEVRRFVNDWRLLTEQQRSITEPAEWAKAVQAYQDAQQAMTRQTHALRQRAQEQLDAFEQALEERLRTAGVPEEQLDAERAGVLALFQPLRERLAPVSLDFNEARGILTALTSAEARAQQRLRELRDRYRIDPGPQPAPELRLRWRDLAGDQRLSSPADVERLLDGLRQQLLDALRDQQTVVLE
ncbi:MAG: BREX system P-loop protein BrxC [Roseiflexaceae bacterium]